MEQLKMKNSNFENFRVLYCEALDTYLPQVEMPIFNYTDMVASTKWLDIGGKSWMPTLRLAKDEIEIYKIQQIARNDHTVVVYEEIVDDSE
jgi:hypothetical protein